MNPSSEVAQVPGVDSSAKVSGPAASVFDALVSGLSARMKPAVETLSYEQYLDRVLTSPHLFLRNSAGYLADAISSYGTKPLTRFGTEILSFECVNRPWLPVQVQEQERIIGQELALFDLYSVCRELARGPHPRKQIMLHGQPGSGKTTLEETIVEAAENYSQSNPEGALYRLAFKVNDEKAVTSIASVFGREDAERINAARRGRADLRLESGWNTDPLFLMQSRRSEPGTESQREALARLISTRAADARAHDGATSFINIDYLLRGELDPFSKTVFEELVRFYKGDVAKVFSRHVVVERWVLDRARGEGINEVSTKGDSHARREVAHVPQGIGAGRDVAPLAESQARTFRVVSPITRSNRGILIHSDMLRVSPGTNVPTIGSYNDLLDAIEHGKYLVEGAVGKIGVCFLSTTTSSDAYRAQEDVRHEFSSFGRRTRFVTIPHIRRADDEQQLVRRAMQRHAPKGEREVDPYVERLIALFTVASRTFPPDATALIKKNEQLSFMDGMTLLEKIILLDERSGPDADGELNLFRSNSKAWNSDQLKKLRSNISLIAEQFQVGVGKTRFVSYEGGSGIPSSETATLVAELVASKPNGCITVLDALKLLEERCEGGFSHYAEVERYRQSELKKLVERAKRAKSKNGEAVSPKDMASITAQAEKQFNAQWRFPRANEVLKQVEEWAARTIRRDVSLALDEATQVSGSTLRTYIEHVRAHLSKDDKEVPAEFRGNKMSRNTGADEALMVAFENTAAGGEDHFSGRGSRAEYRQNILNRLGAAALSHPEDSSWVLNNLPELFPEIARNTEFSQSETPQRKAETSALVANIQKFEDPNNLVAAEGNSLKERELRIYRSVMENLEKKRGYPPSSIPQLVSWAVKSGNAAS
jgi:hypothetical protein